jgi:hypothetical protein
MLSPSGVVFLLREPFRKGFDDAVDALFVFIAQRLLLVLGVCRNRKNQFRTDGLEVDHANTTTFAGRRTSPTGFMNAVGTGNDRVRRRDWSQARRLHLDHHFRQFGAYCTTVPSNQG